MPHQKAEVNSGVSEEKVNIHKSNNLAQNFSAWSAQEILYKINFVQAFDYLLKYREIRNQ